MGIYNWVFFHPYTISGVISPYLQQGFWARFVLTSEKQKIAGWIIHHVDGIFLGKPWGFSSPAELVVLQDGAP